MESRYTCITGRYTPLVCDSEQTTRSHWPGRVLRFTDAYYAVEMICVRCGCKHVTLVDVLPPGWTVYLIEVSRNAGPSPFPGIDLLAAKEVFDVLAGSRQDAIDVARKLETVSFAGLTTVIDVF